MREERDFFYAQVMEMRDMRSAEASVAIDRDMYREQVGDMRLRLRVMRTLAETRLHGLTLSSEGETVAGMREILDYTMREIGEVAGPTIWDTTGDAP
jgi:hypothetical protein